MEGITATAIKPYKITNGSRILIGKDITIDIRTDQRFNWFQKKMIEWCFGFKVEDYSEE